MLDKRGKFIGKFHGLFQEFGSLDPNLLEKVVNIYATSFYGSHLWDFSSNEANKLFNSWNSLLRLMYGVPNTTHRYLLESLSQYRHLKCDLYKRYLTFIHSLTNSRKACLSTLGKRMVNDQGSVTAKNLLLIKNDSGCDNVVNMAPEAVSNLVQYAVVHPGEERRSDFLLELLNLRKNNLELDFEDDIQFTWDELNVLIREVATT